MTSTACVTCHVDCWCVQDWRSRWARLPCATAANNMPEQCRSSSASLQTACLASPSHALAARSARSGAGSFGPMSLCSELLWALPIFSIALEPVFASGQVMP